MKISVFDNAALSIEKINITQLSQTAKELAYDALCKSLPISFYWMDKKGILLGCNQAALDALQLKSNDAFIGKHTSEIVNFEAWKNCQAILDTGIAVSIEEIHTDSEGKQITFLSIKSPIYNEAKEIIGLIGVAVDISERKRLEQELIVAKLAAEKANQAKSEFLLNMSHDIRTPLNGILGFTQILYSKESSPNKKEDLDIIFKSSLKLSSLLNDILEISNIDFSELPMKNNIFNLTNLTNNIADLFSAELKQKNIDLKIDISANTPPQLIGDNTRLHRILVNLIGNSLKFTKKGLVTLSVKLENKLYDIATLIFSVTDTGIGMREDELKIIFDRFQRLSSANQGNYPGSGLGLYIVKKFLDDLKGDIQVNSKLNQGSSFICKIPFHINS